MAELIATVTRDYDFVVIDAAAVLMSTDAAVLARYTDGALSRRRYPQHQASPACRRDGVVAPGRCDPARHRHEQGRPERGSLGS